MDAFSHLLFGDHGFDFGSVRPSNLGTLLGKGFLMDPDKEAPLAQSDRVSSVASGSSILVDQSAVVPKLTPGQQSIKPIDPSTNEPPVRSKILTDHFFRLATQYWNPGDKSIHNGRAARLLFQLPIPQVFFQAKEKGQQCFAPMALLQYYRFLRSDFEFVLQANAQPFAEGQLLMYFEPVFSDGLLDADDIPPTFWKSFLSIFNFPHGFLNLFVNSAVRLSVPFTFFENAFDTMRFTDLGKAHNRCLGWLNVVVLNPLRTHTATSADKIAVTVFGRMVNAEFTGLRPWHELNVWTVSSKQADCGPLKIKNEGVSIQPGAGSMHLSNFEHTVQTHVLGLENTAVKTDVSSFGFKPTEDLLEYAKIPSLTTWTRWDGTWESGHVLFEVPVTPRVELYTYPNFSTEFPKQKDVNVFTTNLSTLSHMFAAWRGSLTFHFQVVMSNFHRGRFAAFFVPGNTFGDSVPSLCQLQSSRFAVFDLGVESTFSFTVPFMDSRPFVNTSVYGRCTGSDPNPAQKGRFHVRDGAMYFHENYSLINCTGMLYVMVINKLQTTSNVSPDIDVNLYMSAGDDFQFFFPVESDFTLEVRNPSHVQGDEQGDVSKLKPKDPMKTKQEKQVAKAKSSSVSDMAKTESAKVDEKSKPQVKPEEKGQPAENALAEPVAGTVGSMEDAQSGGLGPTKDKTVIQSKDVLVPESHTNLCRLLGRAHYYAYQTVIVSGGSGHHPKSLSKYMMRLTVPESGTLGTIFSMNTFWRGPMTVHLTMVKSAYPFTFLIAVFPPGTSCPSSQSAMLAAGASLWDSTMSKSISLEAPYYVQTNGLLTTRQYLGLDESSPRSPTYLGDLVFWPVRFISGEVTFDIALSFHREFSLTTRRPTPIQKVTFSATPDAILDVTRLKTVLSRDVDPVLEIGSEPWLSVSVSREPQLVCESGSSVWKEVAIVRKRRTFYDHYGIQTQRGVVHFNSENIITAALAGIAEVQLDVNPGWEVLEAKEDPYVEEHAHGLIGEQFKYSLLSQNCEHFARVVYSGDPVSTQSTGLKKALVGTAAAASIGAGVGIAGATVTKQGLFDMSSTVTKVDGLVDRLSSYVDTLPSPESLKQSLSALVPDVKTAIIQKIVAYVCKLTGYLSLVITQHNLSTLLGVLVCVAGDIINECSGVKVMHCIRGIERCFEKGLPADEQLSSIAIAAAEGLLEVNMPGSAHKQVANGIKDFNSMTLAWKNVEFLFQRFLQILSWVFTNIKKVMGYPMCSSLEKNKEQLTSWMADCQWCIENEESIRSNATNLAKLETVVAMGDQLVKMRSMWEKKDEFAASLRWYFVQVKSLQLRVVNSNPVSRPEPIVIMLSGEPGQGKSLLATYIAQDLCLINQVNPQLEIYNKPPNAEYYDGYKGQLVHIIDDIGMDPEDKDWRDFTMMVSTTCFRPNMADLSEKGIQYTSRFVILTTNFPDASPVTLRSCDALRRRVLYHYKVSVKPTWATNRGHLDVERATKDRSLFDGSCLNICCGNGTNWTLEQVVKELQSEFIRRGSLHNTFMHMRSEFQEKAYGVTPVHKENVSKESDEPTVEIMLNEYRAVFQKCPGKEIPLVNPYLFKKDDPSDPKWVSIRESIGRLVDKVSNTPLWLKAAFLAGTAFSLVGLGMSVFMWKKLKRLEEKDQGENKQGPYNNVPVVTKPTKPPVQMDVKLVREGVNFEVLEKVAANIVHVSFVPYEGKERRMRGIFVGNDVIMIPQHLVELDSGVLTVHDPMGSIALEVVDGKVDTYRSIRIDDQPVDIMFFHVPGLKRHCKKITHCFATFKELSILPHTGVLLHAREEGVFCLQASKITQCGPIVADGSQLCMRSVRYTCTTAPGFCGQPLCANFPSGHRIVSMHVAGSVGFIGYGIPVWREIIEQVMDECAPTRQFSDAVTVLGEAPEPVHVPTSTKLRPTGLIEPIRAPAILSNAAVAPSFGKYARSYCHKVPPDVVRAKMVALYKAVAQGRPLLTYEQAIYGDGMGLAPLDHQSSAGYPYCIKNLRKQDLYLDPEFQQRVFDTAHGEADVTFATFFKDELRPIEKVRTGKTRLIDAAPLHFTVAFRMAYGHFMSEMHALHGTEIHCMVGCDPESDWTNLFWELMMVGGEDRFIDLDYSAFDASVSRCMLSWVLELLADATAVSFPAMFGYLMRPKRIFKKWIYETDGGLPSGCPCTSILDSMINTAIILTALFEAEGDLVDYQKKVKFVTYGDDVLLSVHPNCKLTPDILIKTAASFGMSMTSADKFREPGFSNYRDVRFLKRSFVIDLGRPQLIHPVISHEVIIDLLAWKRKGAQLVDNCNQALMFAYHHGRDYFQETREVCLKAVSSSELLTFEDCAHRWFGLFD
uniref:Genome polyprotein n=1 Tax=Mops bat picornavirus TaxID=3141893 RepID=A0AAU7E287_9VIRU